MRKIPTVVWGVALLLACARADTATSAALTGTAAPGEGSAPATAGTSGAALAATGSLSATDARATERDMTLPAGIVLPVDLETSVGSDTSRVEQPVRGRLRRPVFVRGIEVLPAGTLVTGHVTRAERPGKVKGRGVIAMRFTELDTPGEGRTRISTATVSRMAPATKEKDALQIIAPAAGGAVVGRIVGGKSGAREGALIGGGAGTAYVLSTRGKDIRLGKGAKLPVRLTSPATIRMKSR
jgi:hypothetical protein